MNRIVVWVSMGLVLMGMPGGLLAETPTQPSESDEMASGDAASDEGAPAEPAGSGEGEFPGPLSYRLPDVVITASRLPEPGFDSPHTVYTLDEDLLRERGYRTTPDALRAVPGVMVQKTGHGQGSPYMRGLTAFHNLFLVDGIRLNNSVFRPGPNQYWNTVDPLSVERYEIVKGPGSVLYGSDAIGGTVNAITRGPQGYGEGINYGGRLTYRLSSAERSQVGRVEAWTTLDRTLGFYVGGSVKNFGDLEGGRDVNTQDETGYDEWDLDLKLEYFFNPDTRLVVGHQTVRQNEAPRTHRTVYAITWEGLTRGTELERDLWQERDLTYIQLHADEPADWLDAVHLGLSWHRQAERRERLRTRNRYDEQGFTVGTVGFTAQFESTTPLGRLVYGAELYHDNVNSFSSRNPVQGPVGDDGSYDLFGVYLQDTIPVCERLDVILGTRYEYARAKARNVWDNNRNVRFRIAEDWEAWVGSGRAVYQIDEAGHWNTFVGVSQGFRAPNLSDLARLDSARTNEFEVPAPGVEPEHFLSYEGGVKASYDDLSLQLAYFYTTIRDMIIRTPTGAVVNNQFEVTKQNAGDGFVQGVELGGSWRFHPQLTGFGTFAWTDGEVDTFPTPAAIEDRQPLDRLMPTMGQVGLRWEPPKTPVWVETTLDMACDADDLSTRDANDTSRIPPGGTPGHAVLSLRGGWQVHDNVRLTLAIENVTDEDYRVHGSGLNEPGRNFVFGLEVTY